MEKNTCGGCDCGCSPAEASACGPQIKSTRLSGSPMDTEIFNQGLEVRPTSLYIIITSLQADGAKPSMTAIAARWNDSPEALEEALTTLRNRNIVVRHPGDENDDPIYLANPASLWENHQN